MYIDKLDNTYIDFKKEINDKHPKFKVCDRVRISKYKTIFAKGYIPNWSDEVFDISKMKNSVHGHMLLMILMVKNCKRISKRTQNRKSN